MPLFLIIIIYTGWQASPDSCVLCHKLVIESVTVSQASIDNQQ